MSTFTCNKCNLSLKWEEYNGEYGTCKKCAIDDSLESELKQILYGLFGGNPQEMLEKFKALKAIAPEADNNQIIRMMY